MHHVALMRPAELVVRYLEGRPAPDEDREWAGVFRCSDEPDIETAFANSEPPRMTTGSRSRCRPAPGSAAS